MLLELAMAGFLTCNLYKQEIVGEDRQCYYKCTDTSKDYASTLKQYQCPKRLQVDRPPLKFKDHIKDK